MPNTSPSANMNLPVPVVGVDSGPQYASDLNSCLTVLDAHNHSSGSGVQITPNGLNISSDLTYSGNNATNLRSLRFTSQASALALSSDLGCLYETGVDLYYNDGNGTQIRITSGGAVAGTPGSISGLSSPASASYNSGTATFIFQSAASTPGNLDAGSVIVREVVASGKGVTMSAPAGLAANYTLTFPAALPSSQKFMTVDSSGNIADSWIYDNSTLTVASNLLKVKDNGLTETQTPVGFGFTPAGAIIAYGGTSAPSGYLLCDGTSYLRASYVNLYAAIGNAYGTADGTHFNVPDLRGQFLRGVTGASANDPDASSRTAMTTGGNTGNNVGSIQTDGFKSHAHAEKYPTGGFGGTNFQVGSGQGSPSGSADASTNTGSTGGNETRPLNAYVNYIIKS